MEHSTQAVQKWWEVDLALAEAMLGAPNVLALPVRDIDLPKHHALISSDVPKTDEER